MSYLVLARKWRPQGFEDLVGQEAIVRILKNAINQNKVAHAYIFSGPRGVGKTTTARILAKALNCAIGPTPEPCGKCQSCIEITDGSSMDVSEIDGASNTSVDNIRDLRERVRYAPSGSKHKVYIIDEAHMLSTSAFNALLKTLEEPPPHVIFVLATTEPKKIPPTVLSRCQHLPFRRISGQKIKERLRFISNVDGINVTDSALEMIARAADGSMRDSLTILDQVTSFSENITESEIKDLLGITDVETLARLSQAMIEGDRIAIVNIISELTNTGTDLKAFTKDFLQFIRNLLIAKIVGQTENILDLSEEETIAINKLKGSTSEEHMAVILSELIKAEPSIRSAFYPRIVLEMTLIRLSLLSHLTSINEALSAISGEIASPEPAPSNKTRVFSNIQNDKSKGSCEDRSNLQGLSLSEVWNAAIKKIDETNHPLYSKLIEGEVSLDDNNINIVFNGGLSVHAESVKENIPYIKNVIHDISGRNVSINIKTREVKSVSKRDLIEDARNNPIIKEAMNLFEGRIVDVIPVSKGGNNV
ncbi:DNA polymerase III, subunit gamma and tau [Dissulfurispira thermophila]|uniref:DNA polymerase III subunit gamma/tau n=1 Tax=Dissulfurispira thermophila TaxID=2715679 RepID=A0A7G1H1U8_9BACT|nr:DNA polymerase III subunit gamma/tau [Dissulfurispira thermophila]BCB96608.1 DNA polymerase III, subunit gamma and tau [Dissulfurispira thermophila]